MRASLPTRPSVTGPCSQPTSRYLRKAAAAKYLGICERTLDDWKRRAVPYRKLGRTVLFDPSELDAALNRFRVAAVGERGDNADRDL